MYDPDRQIAEFALTRHWNKARGDYERLAKLDMLIHGMTLLAKGELLNDLMFLMRIVADYMEEARCTPPAHPSA